ncbi:MAG: SH3 domain-containing protein [Gammaproteobacteria bacterium]|nr:SH3 domain-containing protein [Gammaproteobacteria bacterium]
MFSYANIVGPRPNLRLLLGFLWIFFCPLAYSADVPIFDFSLTPYSQDVESYLPVTEGDDVALVDEAYQKKQTESFYRYYYASDDGGLSPWSEKLVNALLPRVALIEQAILKDFDNEQQDEAHQHYAHNFKKHDRVWLKSIQANMHIAGLSQVQGESEHRAITVRNTHARALPDAAPDFYHYGLPGEGFPFDNLQLSSVYAGTPLYVLHLSKDEAWALVITPHAFIGWVPASDIAYASSEFVQAWQRYAQKELKVVVQQKASLTDASSFYQLTAYLGAVFPVAHEHQQATYLYVPVKNTQGSAIISMVKVDKHAVTSMPMVLSIENIRRLMSELQNQPYGWGGLFFNNDCSSEMLHLFSAFGIWLPRNSAQQASLSSAVDLKERSVDERISFLKTSGEPLLTLIYIGGHVMLYLGEKQHGAFAGEPMTYQNLWGLAPESRDKRYVVGQSVFLPLLKQFSEQPDIQSQAAKKSFSLVFLRHLEAARNQDAFVKRFFR